MTRIGWVGAGVAADAVVVRARTAVASVFAGIGVALATWLSRIPQVRDNLDLAPGELGRMLLALGLGSILALPTAGLLVNRAGAGRAVASCASLAGVGLLVAGFGAGPLASVPVVAVGLFAFGYGHGACDVAMNVEGAAVERRLGRSLMPRLHAGFSLGTVAGAGLGAGAAAVAVPVVVHLGLVAALATGLMVFASRRFLPAHGDAQARAGGQRPLRLWAAWREPRTLLIGVLVLTFALGEGAAYDWLAVAVVDGVGVTNAVGAAGFAVFVTAMTVARMFGTAVLDRFGRPPVLRASAALVIVGVGLVALGGALPVVLAGAVAWGAGTALGFPVGMSAAADEERGAAVRVSVVASISYPAFLAGPPLLGTLGDHVGVQRALLIVVAVTLVCLAVAGATRPLRGGDTMRDVTAGDTTGARSA